MKRRPSLDLCTLGLALCLLIACGGTVTSRNTAAETGDAAMSSSGGAPASGNGGAGGSNGSAAGAQGTGGAPSGIGGSCSLNSDCNAPQVCQYGQCHSMCALSKDCPATQRCVVVSGGSVCQLATEAHCVFNSDCPVPLVCAVDQQCRNQCVSDRDCIAGQLCRANKTCADPSEISVLDAGPACVSGGACTMPGKPCQMGVYVCDGINPAFCKPMAPLPNGTACGPNLVCQGGECVPG